MLDSLKGAILSTTDHPLVARVSPLCWLWTRSGAWLTRGVNASA